ncbi:urease subunit beta [Pseudobacteriovorax antillogorgiicola]|uniref:Urease subunit beta n=1 Tax=Pseudobacteriovorax antillogorgiicola TaxID=1513793 RepID=A0A1Y6BBY0_9BACT|nr:urease subunit beta [Pseudobacteriovorax antillogorgiicola]TCS57294.1 urease subunit beta [Pseudobacteriovorax antillogorgiicola]SMF02983.1 urease subunit beta [Pseudobacteriovorax antillogorgiicola]
MIPGEYQLEDAPIIINQDRATRSINVANSGDRPIQVGSHYHFYEVNPALVFDRESTKGYRLDIPAGTGMRFEPGQNRTVDLVAFPGGSAVFGFDGKVMGPVEEVRNEDLKS